MIARLLNALLGPHCPLDCGQRLYPRDVASHLRVEHAGDPGADPAFVDMLKDPELAAAYLRFHARRGNTVVLKGRRAR